jgi:hypothetical protein
MIMREPTLLTEIIDNIWYDICTNGLFVETAINNYSKVYNFSNEEKEYITKILKTRQEEYDKEFED